MKRILTMFVLLLASISNVSSAIVTSFSNLQIGAKYYNVTIHTSGSFNDIWDIDDDGIFGEGDRSMIDRAPNFWGNEAGATAATTAITIALGKTDGWHEDSDSVWTPFEWFKDSFNPTFVSSKFDMDRDYATDNPHLGTNHGAADRKMHIASHGHSAYASYDEVAPVPLPASAWLFCSGLISLFGFSRRIKAT